MAVEVEKLITVLEAQLAGYHRDLQKGVAMTNQQLGQIERRFDQMNSRVKSSAVSMGAVVGTIGAYLSVDQLLGYANAWTRVTRSLEAGEEAFGITLKSAEELTALANDARVDVEAYTKLYVRTAAAIRDYGYSADAAAEVTSTLAKALKLGSASATEQASVLLQFSQALQKGKLDGDEFRTVMENAGIVQELLAKRLRVTKGEIVKMAAEGKLRIPDLVGAMTDGAELVERVFRKMPVTIDEAFMVLNNSITQYIGHVDKAYGVSQKTSNAVAYLARNIETVGDAALVAGIGLLALFAPAILTGMAALVAGAAALAGPIGLAATAAVSAAAAFELMGDDVKVTKDGLVSFKDVVAATAEEVAHSITWYDKAATSIADWGKTALAWRQRIAESLNRNSITSNYMRGHPARPPTPEPRNAREEAFSAMTLAERIARNSRQRGLGRGFAEGTTLTREHPSHKLATPIDEEAEKRRKKFEREYEQALRQIDVANAEAKAVGRSAFEAAKLRKEQELLTAAREAGIPLTQEELIKIEAISNGYARATTEAETLRNAYNDMSAASKQFLSGFLTDIKNGTGGLEALTNGLNKIADKLIDMAVNDLVEAALGGLSGRGGDAKGGGIGAAIMSLFGGGGGDVGTGSWAPTVSSFARGGIANKPSIFGEAGPEAAVPLPDGRRIPVELRSPAIPKANGGGAANGLVTVQVAASPDLVATIDSRATGVVAKAAPKIVGAAIDGTRKQLPGMMSRAQKRNL